MKQIDQLVTREKIEFIDLKYIGLLGSLHHITIPAQRLKQVLKEGVGIDGSSIPGFKGIKKCDMNIFPDFGYWFVDPFFDRRTMSVLCRAYYPSNRESFEKDPQHAVLRFGEYLGSRGYQVFFLPELEFYLFNQVDFGEAPGTSFFKVIARESMPDGEFRTEGYSIKKKGGYHTCPPFDRTHNFRNELTRILADCGIRVKYHHHEVGPAGQVEIELVFNDAKKTSDYITIAKYLIKNAARKFGWTATFMPKPLYGEPGSGLHLHHYLVKNGEPVFFNKKDVGRLSRFGESYVAGLLEHAPALCALTNPTTNSYKRLISGYEAPTYTDWAVGSRASAIRIPEYVRDPGQQRIEYRIPDAMANPYLALPAIVLAGLDGVNRRLKPEIKKRLPNNLTEALAALKEDHEFLLTGNVFTAEIIDQWIEIKMTEYEAVETRPGPYEFILYFGG